MNTTAVRNYAPQARLDFIQAVTDRAAHFGLTAAKTEPVIERGDVALIGGRAFPLVVARQRKALEDRVREFGFDATMDALAYTWFNRLVAIRYMELRGYLENGEGGASYCVLSHPEGKPTPEILDKAEHVELPRLDRQRVIDLKLDGKETELYRLLLIAQCNALHEAMPFLFEKIEDETELLLPESLLHSDSLVRKLAAGIGEADWQEVEVIGWIYESYIADRYAAVIGKVVAGDDIPAATQRFTPKWVVRYLVQNTLGRTWLATYPASPLKGQMRYYVEPAEQPGEVQEQLRALTPSALNPEEITLLDPACGSAHILAEAYDLFKAIYQERGYRARDIPALILGKNLFGLEIDDRAAQLAAFALMMKARADDARIFTRGVQPNVIALQETKGMNGPDLAAAIREEEAGVVGLVTLFEDAKTFGSLIRVPPKLVGKLDQIEASASAAMSGDIFSQSAARRLMPIIRQAKLLAQQSGCVVANPPYMGSKYYCGSLKTFINKEYKAAKADLYACFIQRNCDFTKPNGFVGMITIPNWMFLSSFEDMRKPLLVNQTIDTFIHNGRGVFGSDFGSCSFVLRNHCLPAYRGSYRRLFEKQGSVSSNSELESRFHAARVYAAAGCDFQDIPGSPIVYRASETTRRAFKTGSPLGTLITPCQGLATTNNDLFLRRWSEVSIEKIGFSIRSQQDATKSGRKWFPFNKGGDFRKWYGNQEFVINFENEGQTICDYIDTTPGVRVGSSGRVINRQWYFKEGITWSDVTSGASSFRYLPVGFILGNVGHSGFPVEGVNQIVMLAFLNTPVVASLTGMLCPTVHFDIGYFRHIPYLAVVGDSPAARGSEAVRLAQQDWDSFETSWDFHALPVMQHWAVNLRQSQEAADAACLARFARMKQLEEDNNRLFIEAYGLQNELSPEVPDEQITLSRPDRAEDVRRLLSYVVGCVMGRYSLDRPGLIYAHGGNDGFDPSQYKTFAADADAIVPLLERDWGFADDAVNRVVEFVGKVWPGDGLEDDLRFLAESLEPKKNEPARETTRRYLATGFFKDHLKTYRKRPIYWLFSSGKERAFQALVYLHRYHEGTLARMRTEYVIPLQSRIDARIEQLAGDIPQATSTSHRRTLQKEQDALKRQQTELLSYDEKLRHAADQRITLDLDAGVKVNYGKLGDLLACVKDVYGMKEED